MIGSRGGDEGDAGAARRIAEALGTEGGPRVVALLADPERPEASWGQAGRLCDAVAVRRRTLVANLAGAGSGFDGFLGVEEDAGLEGVREGRIRLSEAPVPVPGRRFLYLPAGPRAADAGEAPPPPLADPDLVRAVEKLAVRIREADGTLLLYLTPDAVPDRQAADLIDAAVRLAGAVSVAGVPTIGRLGSGEGGPDVSVEAFLGLPDEPEEGEPAAAGTEGEPATAPDGEGRGGDDAADGAPESSPEREGAAEEPAGSETAEEPAGAGTATTGPDGTPGPGPAAGEPTEVAGPAGAGGEGTPREPTRGEEEASPAFAVGSSAAPGGASSAAAVDAGDEDGGAGPDGDGAHGGSGWRSHRRSSGWPTGRILLGLLLVAGLAGGWWYLTRRAATGSAAGGPPAADARTADAGRAPGAAADPTADTGGARPADAPADTGDGRPGDAAPTGAEGDAAAGAPPDAAAIVERSPELPYSVLVASYLSWSAARERLDRWSAADDAPVLFAAPTPVGDGVYWRVFAGALADREAGRALNGDVARRGWKEEAAVWDVRPAALAFRISVEASRSAAVDRAASLREDGVPAYALPAAADGDTAWAVWAGAYESRDAAGRLGARLQRAGIEAELVTRRGAAGGP